MAAPTKSFTSIADSLIDAGSPLTETVMTYLRDNDEHLEEWLGKDYTAAQNHDHDGVNSAVAEGFAPYASGDIENAASNVEVSTSSGSYVKKKEIVVVKKGTIKVTWQMRTAHTSSNYYGKIYVNGSPVGVEITSNSLAYQPYEDEIEVEDQDHVQLYLKSGNGSYLAYAQLFKIKSDRYQTETVLI